MSNDPISDDPTKGMSWAEKKRYAAKQVREEKLRAIAAAREAGDDELADSLTEELGAAKKERAEAKAKARDLKKVIKEKLPSSGGRTWANNEIARAVRSGRNADGVKPRNPVTQWNMQPGQMVRLVNKAEAWTESYMQKILPKGAIGILLAPPTGSRVAVMFGADVYTISCKKLRPVTDE